MTRYILDTDHLSLYERSHPQVCQRIQQVRQQPAIILQTTVITLEEQYVGRLRQLQKAKTAEARISTYRRLRLTFEMFTALDVLDYSSEAEQNFQNFRRQGIRIGTQDLRIASITIAEQGILITRNRRDFEKVPGLSIEDWSI
jgi:tRNA(fMet)-specific endonuclease VapC